MGVKQKLFHRRKSLRLKNYDYSQMGAYFITICAYKRICLFGEISDEQMQLNEYGNTVKAAWNDLPAHYSNVNLDDHIIMPNHVHGIIWLTGNTCDTGNACHVGAGFKPAPTLLHNKSVSSRHGLSEIIRGFKTFSAKRVNLLRGMPSIPVWQRGYYEHVIRNEEDLDRIRKYIRDNPVQWASDSENTANHK